jgi:hypothetical protein
MHASTPLILRKSRMRRRARTDLCGGRSLMIVPTATVICRERRDEEGPPENLLVSGKVTLACGLICQPCVCSDAYS